MLMSETPAAGWYGPQAQQWACQRCQRLCRGALIWLPAEPQHGTEQRRRPCQQPGHLPSPQWGACSCRDSCMQPPPARFRGPRQITCCCMTTHTAEEAWHMCIWLLKWHLKPCARALAWVNVLQAAVGMLCSAHRPCAHRLAAVLRSLEALTFLPAEVRCSSRAMGLKLAPVALQYCCSAVDGLCRRCGVQLP